MNVGIYHLRNGENLLREESLEQQKNKVSQFLKSHLKSKNLNFLISIAGSL